MTNADVLARPDVIAALQCWWDETRSWAQGVTSSVVADLLDEYGYTVHLRDGEHPVQDYMRSVFVVNPRYHPDFEPFEHAAGVFSITTGTVASPKGYHMVQWMLQQMRWLGASYNDIAVHGHILVSEEDAGKMARSREVREYMTQKHPAEWVNRGNPLAMFGLPCTMLYGVAILLNECQTPGQIDMVCGEHIVTARTMP